MADYNINAVTRRVVFTGSAGLGPYSFTFEVLDQNDLAVYFNATLLTLTTDYTVTINANGTGSVTIVTGANVPSTPTASDQIVIVGARDIERTTDFVTAGDLRASALNEQLDSQIIMIQQIAEENRRGMRAPVYDPALAEDGGVVDMTLPTKASRAGKSLAFDNDGNPIAGEDIGNWRGDWAASTSYDVRDIVKDPNNYNIYRCNTAHTSSGSAPISGNADSAKWDLVIDASSAADAQAAQAAAEAAQAAAETAETNAATSESNSSSSATSSANSATASASSASASAASASAASTSESNASTSETNAASSASSASTSASTATTQAGIATTKAGEAASSASSASASDSTATTQAGIATTKAGEAATSATNAATSETNAATSESNAASSATSASASQVAAAASAASAASAFDNFDDTYLGSYATDPTVDNDGDALVQGALYFNSAANEMRVYDGGSWIAASSAGGVSLLMYEYTATAAQTTFSGSDDNANTLSYTIDNIIVTLNGITLDPSDYTATSGTSIVLASGAALNDELNVVAFKSFTTADMVSATNGGTFGNDVTVTGDLDVTGNVGIGTTSPIGKFMVKDGTSSPSALVVRQTSEAGAAALSLDSIFNNVSNTDKEVASIKLGVITNGSASPNADIRFETVSSGTLSEAMRIDSSGNLLVGKTSPDSTIAGVIARPDGFTIATRDGGAVAQFRRLTSDGDIALFYKDSTTVGSIGSSSTSAKLFIGGGNVGITFTGSGRGHPTNNSGVGLDNAMDWGQSNYRFDDIYATNGTIQTSDQNEKQQIASLTDAEMTAAKAISALFKTFKWNDKVAEKGDAARTHTGVIAQDVQQAMTDAGLDAGDYAFFISSTWWETQTDVPAVEAVAEVLDEDGNVVTEAVEAKEAYTRTDTYDTAEEAPEGATERTRLGVRYPELLAFIGAATEQRLANIETRLAALENV